jgi:polyphenol oxidase
VSALGLIEVPTGAPARAVFTTRRGGASAGPLASLNLSADRGDSDAAVRDNRRRLCDALGLDPSRVAMAHQVHGAGVREVSDDDDGRFTGDLRGWPESDALVTFESGRALVVLGADCLPVLLWRRDRPAVSAVHAGWRGLVAGVVERAVAALGAPESQGAAIGPGIGPCCYPVSPEVRGRFADRFGDEVVQGDAVDLAAAARRALGAAGVPSDEVRSQPACTSCDGERFYSHRRDGGSTGRHGGVVWSPGEAA